jgi:4'-phosphopantetheinyl transferase
MPPDPPAQAGIESAPFPSRLTILPNHVHIVRCCLEKTFGGAAELLDDDERARAARFVFSRDRRRFIAAHSWVRVVLGRCLDRDPASLRFATGPRGKPHLVDPPLDVRFNLSHAGERALLALTLGRNIGVDVEQERSTELLALARRFLAPAEAHVLEGLAASDQRATFFRCWTRKEAFVKALGDGLAFPFDAFEVSLADEDSSPRPSASGAVPHALHDWRIVSLHMESGYAAAVAAQAGDWDIVRWNAVA